MSSLILIAFIYLTLFGLKRIMDARSARTVINLLCSSSDELFLYSVSEAFRSYFVHLTLDVERRGCLAMPNSSFHLLIYLYAPRHGWQTRISTPICLPMNVQAVSTKHHLHFPGQRMRRDAYCLNAARRRSRQAIMTLEGRRKNQATQ